MMVKLMLEKLLLVIESLTFFNLFYMEINYDLNSKLVLEGKTLTDTPVRITGIMNGIYFIKLKFGNRVETHRIIKTQILIY